MKSRDYIITEAMLYITFLILIACFFIILLLPKYQFILPKLTTPVVFLWGVRVIQTKALMFCSRKLLVSILVSSLGILALYIMYIFVHISPLYHVISSMCFDVCTAGLFVSICLGICEMTKEKILSKKVIRNYIAEKKKNSELSAEIKRLKESINIAESAYEHNKQ